MLGCTQSGVSGAVLPHVTQSRPRARTAAALVLCGLLVVVGCGGGGGRSPGATLPGTGGASPTPLSTGAGRTASPIATASAPGGPWPAGWDTTFCAAFAQLVVMQELAVDIGRALDDDAREDAMALTAELAEVAGAAREQVGELPPWEAAAPLERQLVALLELADEMALRYSRYFETDRRNALAAAQAAGGRMNEVVPKLLERLELLSEAGLSCPGLAFTLETPPRP
jgi:hypothetical protein